MFARKLRVEYGAEGQRQPVPLKWLDSFAMRNFTNDPIFDDTLPAADGVLEVGTRVPVDRLQASMEDWFRKKSYLAPAQKLLVSETSGQDARTAFPRIHAETRRLRSAKSREKKVE